LDVRPDVCAGRRDSALPVAAHVARCRSGVRDRHVQPLQRQHRQVRHAAEQQHGPTPAGRRQLASLTTHNTEFRENRTMFQHLATKAVKRAMTVGAAALLVAAQACGSDSPTSSRSNNNNNDNTDPRGTYTLRTVDGKSLPYQISRSPYRDPETGHFY